MSSRFLRLGSSPIIFFLASLIIFQVTPGYADDGSQATTPEQEQKAAKEREEQARREQQAYRILKEREAADKKREDAQNAIAAERYREQQAIEAQRLRARFTNEVADGPSYMVIPCQGTVGDEITAAYLKTCLDAAIRIHPTIIIIEIESPGGLVSELTPICDLLEDFQQQHKDIRVVSLVKHGGAYSAAAMIAMSCREIFLQRGAAIGAAMAINVHGDGNITPVAEKLASAYRGKMRSVVEATGHNPLLAEAMMDSATELWLSKTDDGKPILSTEKKPGARLVNRSGRLLTLRARSTIT